MVKKKFLIIDGSSLFYRAFYGIQMMMKAPTGEYTNAIYGFSNMLVQLLDQWRPDYMVIAFDKSKQTFRKKLYADYKGNRKPTPDELKSQIPILHELAEAWGIAFRELEGYEADDILGTLSKKAVENGCDAYIVTGDRDALQLIGEGRKVLYTKKGTSDLQVWDEERFAEEYNQLSPIQLVDLKGLMGDASDNIPGVPGIGPKTAQKLISSYGSVEEVLSHVAELSGKKVRENIRDYPDQALLSKRLATINQNVPIDYDAAAFRLKPKANKVMDFYNKYAMRSIIKTVGDYFERMGEREAFLKAAQKEKLQMPEFNSWYDASADKGEVWINFLYDGKVPNIKIKGAAISDGENYYYILPDEFSWFSLEQILQDTKVKKYIYNLKMAYHAGLDIAGEIIDLELIGYLIDPSSGKYKIQDLAKHYLKGNLGEEEFTADKKKKLNENELQEINVKELKWQTFMLVKMSPLMLAKIKEFKLMKLYSEIELPLVEVLASMESNGIKVNEEKLAEQTEIIGREIGILEMEIYMHAATKFNINSPKQLGEILFERLQLTAKKKTKTGYSTDVEVLEGLINAHPIIEKIINYRILSKLKSTYLDSIAVLLNKDTKRIYTNFNQTVTATGRLSSSEPNLQNIPVRTEIGKQIRALFEPGDGYDFLVSADYSQIELRVLASMSGDEAFINAFNNGEDIHARTAAEVFNVPIDDITPRMRNSAKAVNFGIVYGISDFGLAKDLKITRKEAAGYIKSYFDKCPGIKKFLDKTVAQAKKEGMVETMFGRRRALPEIKNSNFNIRSLAERMAMNTPIQGTAADIIKIAMIRAYQQMKAANLKSRILLQVHDELVLEVVEDELPQIKEILNNSMEKAANLLVPLTIDINIGKNWANAK